MEPDPLLYQLSPTLMGVRGRLESCSGKGTQVGDLRLRLEHAHDGTASAQCSEVLLMKKLQVVGIKVILPKCVPVDPELRLIQQKWAAHFCLEEEHVRQLNAERDLARAQPT